MWTMQIVGANWGTYNSGTNSDTNDGQTNTHADDGGADVEPDWERHTRADSESNGLADSRADDGGADVGADGEPHDCAVVVDSEHGLVVGLRRWPGCRLDDEHAHGEPHARANDGGDADAGADGEPVGWADSSSERADVGGVCTDQLSNAWTDSHTVHVSAMLARRLVRR